MLSDRQLLENVMSLNQGNAADVHIVDYRTHLDERSARRRDLYPTTYNACKIQTSMAPARFEPPNPCKRVAAHPRLARAAAGIAYRKAVRVNASF